MIMASHKPKTKPITNCWIHSNNSLTHEYHKVHTITLIVRILQPPHNRCIQIVHKCQSVQLQQTQPNCNEMDSLRCFAFKANRTIISCACVFFVFLMKPFFYLPYEHNTFMILLLNHFFFLKRNGHILMNVTILYTLQLKCKENSQILYPEMNSVSHKGFLFTSASWSLFLAHFRSVSFDFPIECFTEPSQIGRMSIAIWPAFIPQLTPNYFDFKLSTYELIVQLVNN